MDIILSPLFIKDDCIIGKPSKNILLNKIFFLPSILNNLTVLSKPAVNNN